jgi:hypothetical protein
MPSLTDRRFAGPNGRPTDAAFNAASYLLNAAS